MPDTLSDLHAASINSPSYPTLPWVMSKFLALGMPLDEIVARTTRKTHWGASNPRPPTLSILDLVESRSIWWIP